MICRNSKGRRLTIGENANGNVRKVFDERIFEARLIKRFKYGFRVRREEFTADYDFSRTSVL